MPWPGAARISSGSCHFLHDPNGHLLAEATAAGATTTEYVWLGDTPLAMVADADTARPRLFWFHTDHLGTPQKLTDSAGNLAWDAVLEPFGELASLTVNLVAQPLRLPGQYADPETGLHQNWWRDYDPSLGRYLQPDPLGITAGPNLYGHVDGNPSPDSTATAESGTRCLISASSATTSIAL